MDSEPPLGFESQSLSVGKCWKWFWGNYLSVFPHVYRCACFYGPACPGSLDDPCQPYQLPPTIPTVYTLYYNGKVTTCGPTGCHDTYLRGREVLNLTEHKKRDDSSNSDQSIFVLPGNVSGFDQVNTFSDFFTTVTSGAGFRSGSTPLYGLYSYSYVLSKEYGF